MVVIAAWVPTGRVTMTLVLVVTDGHGKCVIRSQVMVLRQRDFVTSAIVPGEPAWRIIVTRFYRTWPHCSFRLHRLPCMP